MEIQAKTKMEDGSVVETKVVYNDMISLEELQDLCGGGDKGAEVILSLAKAEIIKTIQARVRGAVKKGKDPQKAIDAFIPGVKAPKGLSDSEKIMKSYTKMTPEDRMALIEDLKGLS